MADSSQPYNKIPYKNIYSCKYSNGISIIQPEYQVLPDGSTVNNPAYVSSLASSFWTYKFIIDCDMQMDGSIKSIGIPICHLIKSENIKVYEWLDCNTVFNPVPFTLIKNDPSFYYAPKGFKWLKIENLKRYYRGVCVEYILEIFGNYVSSRQSLKIKTTYNIIKFTEDSILVPTCNSKGNLTVKKSCFTSIINNKAILKYKVNILNTGNTALNNVIYNDKIYIPTSFILGKIHINTSNLSIDRNIPGQILINGRFDIIKPGQMLTVIYSIPVENITKPKKYKIGSNVVVSAMYTSAHSVCSSNIDVVKLSSENHCSIINQNKVSFILTIWNTRYSPDTEVTIINYLFIPSGITLQFNNFGMYTATFGNKYDIVPINTNITGPQNIILTCRNLKILQDGCTYKAITFKVISSTIAGKITITNTLKSITLANPNSQVLIDIKNLSSTSNIDILPSVKCQ